MMEGLWNLKHLYEGSDEFKKDLKIAKKYLENIKKFKGKLNSADVILDYFTQDACLSVVLEKLAVYAFCKKR